MALLAALARLRNWAVFREGPLVRLQHEASRWRHAAVEVIDILTQDRSSARSRAAQDGLRSSVLAERPNVGAHADIHFGRPSSQDVPVLVAHPDRPSLHRHVAPPTY